MRIADVLKTKGDSPVVTIRSDAEVLALLELLAQHRIGAVIVSDDADDPAGPTIAGIVSERDIVRRLAKAPDSLHATVASIMISDVHTCTPTSTVADLAAEMTEHRFRHMPVVVDGRLVGLVGIGDIVKSRIGMLQDEADHLTAYLHQ